MYLHKTIYINYSTFLWLRLPPNIKWKTSQINYVSYKSELSTPSHLVANAVIRVFPHISIYAEVNFIFLHIFQQQWSLFFLTCQRKTLKRSLQKDKSSWLHEGKNVHRGLSSTVSMNLLPTKLYRRTEICANFAVTSQTRYRKPVPECKEPFLKVERSLHVGVWVDIIQDL